MPNPIDTEVEFECVTTVYWTLPFALSVWVPRLEKTVRSLSKSFFGKTTTRVDKMTVGLGESASAKIAEFNRPGNSGRVARTCRCIHYKYRLLDSESSL